jgi:hypothetical protein
LTAIDCPDPHALAALYAAITGWPGQEHPQQEHLDFSVDDLDEGERRVLAIGARRHTLQPGQSFRVYLDPVDHPFCLVAS